MIFARRIVLVTAFFLGIVSGGCKSAMVIPITDGADYQRKLTVQWGDSDPHPSPYELRAIVFVSAGAADSDKRPFWKQIDLDYGDSSGWVDYTEAMTNYFSGDIQYEDLPVHLYDRPGKYTLQARVVYWDGEVVGNNTQYSILTILPPGGE